MITSNGAFWDEFVLTAIDSDVLTALDVEIRDINDAVVTSCDFVADTCTNGFTVSDTGTTETVDLSSLLVAGDYASLSVEIVIDAPLTVDLDEAVPGVSPSYRLSFGFPGSPPPVELCLVTDPTTECPVTGLEQASNSADVRISGAATPDGSVGPVSLNVLPVGGAAAFCASDYGDAPDSYATLLASNGAGHVIDSSLLIGTALDGEADGQPGLGADGDDSSGATPDDEDGVTIPATLTAGDPYSIQVTVTGSGLLSAWVDWNGDGDFTGVGEQIATEQAFVGPVSSAFLTGTVPATAVGGTTYARFRVCTAAGDCSAPVGPASDGEVEDYSTSILSTAVLADVAITKADGTDPVIPGASLTYTLVVTNNGPSTATSVVGYRCSGREHYLRERHGWLYRTSRGLDLWAGHIGQRGI